MESHDAEALIRSLIIIASHQQTITDDLRAWIAEQRVWNQEQRAMNERLEQMLRGMLPPSPNGH